MKTSHLGNPITCARYARIKEKYSIKGISLPLLEMANECEKLEGLMHRLAEVCKCKVANDPDCKRCPAQDQYEAMMAALANPPASC